MTNTQAILVGAAIIAGSILSIGSIHPASAGYNGGAYQLMHHSNTTANAGVFKLDTATGGISYCYINAAQALTCTGEIK
ncbi:MAG: hypothetical protein WC464_00435 [Bdellovibrionales bacterium]